LTGTSRRATILGIRIECDDAIMESRKQAVRDVWAYRPVEHIPIMLSVAGNPWGYSVKDQLFDVAPDVIVIPQLSIGEEDDAAAYYAAMLEVSKEYAERMWGR
jgi:hypothetical protein